MDKRVPLEKEEAAVLVAFLRIKGYPFTHVPLETGHSREAILRAMKMKREGVSKGFPDYIVVVGPYLVFVELKRVSGSTVSQEQRTWIETLNAIPNVSAIIARGAEPAIKEIERVAALVPRPVAEDVF